MIGMSPRREEVLEFIASFKAGHAYSPTVREIADGLHLNTTTIQHHLVWLQRLGKIRRNNGWRTLVICENPN